MPMASLDMLSYSLADYANCLGFVRLECWKDSILMLSLLYRDVPGVIIHVKNI